MQLSKNFWLSEFTKSHTAVKLKIDNTPDEEQIEALETLCKKALQPARDVLGRLNINSGFRCLELNRALGSKDSSQHLKGQAADIESENLSNLALAKWLRDNVPYDQIILEFYNKKDPRAGWVHFTYVSEEKNRRQCLTIDKDGIRFGLG